MFYNIGKLRLNCENNFGAFSILFNFMKNFILSFFIVIGFLVYQPAFGYGGAAIIFAPPTQTIPQNTEPNLQTENILSEKAEKIDVNKDNKINIIDFNKLMVDWGKSGINTSADFNSDGAVDVFDFNLLMVNWQE
ncbi:hypothetical protein A2645_01335 [Candidatus Nomurabacteria bacterium RIFCSPHIGHO2_01_FULL_39_9]|uniref:Dockerin domain-containing protein n=1 Tax=Candidatus Nomurabacteria bacterium RIFCSPHIGHO2_01_FULL_39_9 TaxID=1801735 RepID=A0A1F6UY78_9BACT|nr:MAG: hypothetical protein A2645_01335 [Candidatus Nomurabacteria bacterium RIFCSPHIGHO2_01_FULL_39_9]